MSTPSPVKNEQPFTTYDDLSELNKWKFNRRKIVYKPSPVRGLDCFTSLEVIGEGTYGKVYKAIDKRTNKFVALKRMKMNNEKEGVQLTTIREIKILNQIRHQNVIRLLEVIVENEEFEQGKDVNIYMVFEFVEHDLNGLLQFYGKSFSEAQIKGYIRQLLAGLEHCHKNMVIHRDIKGANLLINNSGVLKIADFGLSRKFRQEGKYTNKMVTLWYRAPELLLGVTDYDCSVDVWSVGCVLLELYHGTSAFRGKEEIEQLNEIFRICGTPNEHLWPTAFETPNFSVFRPRKFYSPNLKGFLIQNTQIPISEEGIDLVQKLLTLDPKKRISIEDALKHPYFHTPPLPLQLNEYPKYTQSCYDLYGKRQRQERDKNHPPPPPPILPNASSNQSPPLPLPPYPPHPPNSAPSHMQTTPSSHPHQSSSQPPLPSQPPLAQPLSSSSAQPPSQPPPSSQQPPYPSHPSSRSQYSYRRPNYRSTSNYPPPYSQGYPPYPPHYHPSSSYSNAPYPPYYKSYPPPSHNYPSNPSHHSNQPPPHSAQPPSSPPRSSQTQSQSQPQTQSQTQTQSGTNSNQPPPPPNSPPPPPSSHPSPPHSSHHPPPPPSHHSSDRPPYPPHYSSQPPHYSHHSHDLPPYPPYPPPSRSRGYPPYNNGYYPPPPYRDHYPPRYPPNRSPEYFPHSMGRQSGDKRNRSQYDDDDNFY